jgi:hypothetical protein
MAKIKRNNDWVEDIYRRAKMIYPTVDPSNTVGLIEDGERWVLKDVATTERITELKNMLDWRSKWLEKWSKDRRFRQLNILNNADREFSDHLNAPELANCFQFYFNQQFLIRLIDMLEAELNSDSLGFRMLNGAQVDEDLPKTFAELFTKPDTDLPKLTAIFQEHNLVDGNGKWVDGKKSRKRTLMLVATDALLKYSGFKSYYGDSVIAPLISDHYGVTLSKRSYSNRAQDRTGLKDAVRLAFPKD